MYIQANAQSLTQLKDSTQQGTEVTLKKHSPGKATMYSAVLPGLGQFYNKKYYKIPIIYGGFIGLGYEISFYNQKYINFKQAYYDLHDNNPLTKSYEKTFPYYDYSKTADFNNWSQTFLNGIDFYRRYRDIFIISTVGFYLLNILDANVDAHFMDFDISNDLTINFEPFIVDPMTNSAILGGQLVINF